LFGHGNVLPLIDTFVSLSLQRSSDIASFFWLPTVSVHTRIGVSS